MDKSQDWKVSEDGKSISAEYAMKNFVAAVELMNQISEIAEAEDHHPDMHLTSYRKLRLELSTHSEGKLTEKDYKLAALIDKLPKKLK